MLSIADFQQPFFDLSRQGTAANPKEVPLVVIAWEPKGKNEPPISVAQLQQMIFGAANSLAHWFQENSQGRYRIIPHPTHPIIGPFLSANNWQFYWRNGPFLPPPPGDLHCWVDPGGKAYYLDDQGFIDGHVHAYAEAIRTAASVEGVNLSVFDRDRNGELSQDECLILIVKAQANTDGFGRYHWAQDYRDWLCGSQVPWTPLVVDGVWIKWVSELYAAPPHGDDDLAVAVEEVLHQACNLADQYSRPADDPGQPGQLALTDAGRRPVHIDPYHKLKWGWLNPQLADHSGRYTLRDVATTGDALILYSPYFGTDEFFILENRWRGNSYDRFRSNDWQEGLALWHCIQDPNLKADWGRRAVHLRRADPRLNNRGNVQNNLALFDGNDPTRGYDLHDDSQPQNLRFRNGMPSRIRIRNISPAGPTMTVDVEVPPKRGEVIQVKGKILMMRVHEHGTGYGPQAHRLNEDCIVTLDSEPGTVFGLDLSSANIWAGRSMFDHLRTAFQSHIPIVIEYEAINAIGGHVLRVINTR
jgi:M6 family metalloprotease-like protein